MGYVVVEGGPGAFGRWGFSHLDHHQRSQPMLAHRRAADHRCTVAVIGAGASAGLGVHQIHAPTVLAPDLEPVRRSVDADVALADQIGSPGCPAGKLWVFGHGLVGQCGEDVIRLALVDTLPLAQARPGPGDPPEADGRIPVALVLLQPKKVGRALRPLFTKVFWSGMTGNAVPLAMPLELRERS